MDKAVIKEYCGNDEWTRELNGTNTSIAKVLSTPQGLFFLLYIYLYSNILSSLFTSTH